MARFLAAPPALLLAGLMVLAAAAAGPPPARAAQPAAAGIRAFSLADVQLLRGSEQRANMDYNLRFLMMLEVDRLVRRAALRCAERPRRAGHAQRPRRLSPATLLCHYVQPLLPRPAPSTPLAPLLVPGTRQGRPPSAA